MKVMIKELIKTGADNGSIEAAKNEKTEIWISPKHWKIMTPEKRAVVVDLWHTDHKYSKTFPFEAMRDVRDASMGLHNVGITLEGREDNLENARMIEVLKILKVPHVHGSYSDVSDKKQKLVGRKK